MMYANEKHLFSTKLASRFNLNRVISLCYLSGLESDKETLRFKSFVLTSVFKLTIP